MLDTPEWFRQEAEKCFLLAEKTTDEKAADALLTYGSELLARAERMEETARKIVSAAERPIILCDPRGGSVANRENVRNLLCEKE